jgi:hypothetical protein
MLEVSSPFYRQRTCAMSLESALLTKESLEHGKAPSWKDLPESTRNWNLCGVNRVELLGKRPEIAGRPHIFCRNIFTVAVLAECLSASAFEVQTGGIHKHKVETSEQVATMREQALLP